MVSHLLLLLGLICLQSFTTAQNVRGSEVCCFNFNKIQVPVKFVKDYRETRTDCTYPGVIFLFHNGRRVCVNPNSDWVKEAMKKIDRRLFGNSTQPAIV